MYDLDPKVKVIGKKAGICDGVPSTAALVELKIVNISYPSILTYVLGAQKNRLNETVRLSTHNICFG